MSHDEDTRADGGDLIPAESGPEEERSLRSQEDQEPSLRQLIELERSRIDRDNRRTEVLAKALELANDQDKRQFEFASEGQRLEDKAEQRRFVFGGSFAAGVFVVLAVIIGLTIWMAFFGDDEQRAVAQGLGKNGLVGLAGFGVVSGLVRLVRSLVRAR